MVSLLIIFVQLLVVRCLVFAIFEEFSESVLPLIHVGADGSEQVGTSFLLHEDRILTAAHCVRGASALAIRGIGRSELREAAFFSHRNEALDIGLIQFARPVLRGVKPLLFGEGTILQEVVVLGYPNVPGFTRFLAAERATISARISATRGMIASRALEIFSRGPLFLITARVRGGFSGGPVIGDRGFVVGIVSREPTSPENGALNQYDELGYGVAIPVEYAEELVNGISQDDAGLFEKLDMSNVEFRDFDR